MKTIYFFFIITMVFALFSCTTDSDEVFFIDSFFPLKVGDRFVYKATSISPYLTHYKNEVEVKTIGIKDTLGKKYYMLLNYRIVPGFPETTFVRKENKNIYFLGYLQENLHYSFNPPYDSMNYIHYFGSESNSDLVVKRTIVNSNFIFSYCTSVFESSECLVKEKFIKDVGREEISFFTQMGEAHYKLIK